MKRPHRRIHLLVWLFMAPVTALAGFYFWMQRPATPYSDLPQAIEAIETANEGER